MHLKGQHTDGVKACLFLHDNDFAATSSADGSMCDNDCMALMSIIPIIPVLCGV